MPIAHLVCEVWDLGLVVSGVAEVGEKARFHIPADLAYGHKSERVKVAVVKDSAAAVAPAVSGLKLRVWGVS